MGTYYCIPINTSTLRCIVKLPEEVCASHTKHVGEINKFYHKKFAEVLLTSLLLKKLSYLILEESTWRTTLVTAAPDQNAADLQLR